jgi:uncharacterized protein YggU (UPF0235/DUF167 family)
MFRVEGKSVNFWLKVKPRSARERLRFDSAGELRLDLYAAPVEGQANEACVRYLARVLGLPQSSVAILSGAKSRRKLLRVTGESGQEIAFRLRGLATGL